MPTWRSLSFDYLAIMASAVSSERVFSSAGITITKRRNRLKGDVVEALQILKHAVRNGKSLFSDETDFDEESSDEDDDDDDDDNEDAFNLGLRVPLDDDL